MKVLIDGVEYVPRAPTISDFSRVTVGEALRMMRKEARLSQRSVSKEIGCSTGHLCNIEYGKTLPGLLLSAKIASFYGVSLDVFAGCLEFGKP